MMKKKICLIGGHMVGKTSLVARFVKSIFSPAYFATVGVKVDKKTVHVGTDSVDLMIWDIATDGEFKEQTQAFVLGGDGVLLVVDRTRKATLVKALDMHRRLNVLHMDMAVVLVVNKNDLQTDWEISDKDIEDLREQGWHVSLTSAKTGEGVEDTFAVLTRMMLSKTATQTHRQQSTAQALQA